jgi:tetratricopeptide (TPR) repeat protein
LVPLADAEIQQGNLAVAAQDARTALDCLQRFLRPVIFSEKEWSALEKQLRASSYYVLGKAATEQGLNAQGPERDRKLQEAEGSTRQSFQLNPSDPTTSYLLGLIRLVRGNLKGAASAFAVTYQQRGPLREKAEKHLQEVYEHWPSKRVQGFDAFVREVANSEAPV